VLNRRKVGMTSSPHAFMTRATHGYNGRYKALQSRETEPIAKNRSQFGLESATRLHEVGIASNRGSARRGEYVPGLVHTARHTMGVSCLQKWLAQPQGRRPLRSDW